MRVLKVLWPYLLGIGFWVLAALVFFDSCEGRKLKKENEQLREQLARQQQYVPLQRDTIRDTVEVVTQQVIEVERVKNVLTTEDRELLKDIDVRVSAIESYQKLSTKTEAEVKLAQPDSKSEGRDSLLTYKDAWLDLTYHTNDSVLLIELQDSLAIAVEKEYKRRFLWWRWGTKGYKVKAVSFNPYTSIRYNTYVKAK